MLNFIFESDFHEMLETLFPPPPAEGAIAPPVLSEVRRASRFRRAFPGRAADRARCRFIRVPGGARAVPWVSSLSLRTDRVQRFGRTVLGAAAVCVSSMIMFDRRRADHQNS